MASIQTTTETTTETVELFETEGAAVVTFGPRLQGLTMKDICAVETASLNDPVLNQVERMMCEASVKVGRLTWQVPCGLATKAELDEADKMADYWRRSWAETKAVAIRRAQRAAAGTLVDVEPEGDLPF